MTEQCTNGCPTNGNLLGLNYRSANSSDGWIGTLTWHGAASYVAGAHSLKVGYSSAFYINDQQNLTNVRNILTYRVNDAGYPTRSQSWGSALHFRARCDTVRAAFNALFVPDQWTMNRLTLQGAAAVRARVEPLSGGAGLDGSDLFHPDPAGLPGLVGVPGFNDLGLAAAGAYGPVREWENRRSRSNVGKYLPGGQQSGSLSTVGIPPPDSFQQTTARNWTDGNGNYIPDCDLMNPAGAG